ncbi:MAG: KEOPS complex subunit Pcc1 [Candidatus Bathyarchaeota archaeon]|nr:KEOPS complex subunit Pcc1 [Candidatus Bathyarchaeota archaeon]MCX8177317.1 KEOPS complex subunit Pcc1 [Candidatus Bathyarchaeota archaeon]MDW8193763.1 KEOPS complex subunit Pcc1 [Nitrososphaerota archaeon]
MKAEILITYNDDQSAECAFKAASPDNLNVPPGLTVNTARRNNEVLTVIKCNRSFKTFIATIDDLLFSISLAEKTLRTLRKLNRASVF